jgi:putative YpdA family bacillithiol system oxidoreductase
MVMTTLGFFVLTAVMVWLHLRSRPESAGPAAAPQKPAGKPCPRCEAHVAQGSTFCPACGVPLQIFDVVNAPTSEFSAPAASGAKMRALVRADMCVGCGTCVAECPEPGAITMRGKLAVVDDDKCKGHGNCVKGCPVGAISMNAGAAVNRVKVPFVKPSFETNVPGIYIVGELGGRGLIKNAINEGKLAVEHVARALASPDVAAPGQGPLDVVIVGSGPAGLSAALEAHRRKLRYVVLEQGSLSDTVRKYPRHKVLLAESVQIPLYGDLWVADCSKEELLHVWETLVQSTGLVVRTGEKVERIAREGDAFRIGTTLAEYSARRVVLATGRRGSPRRLGVAGEELDKVFYDIVEMEAFAGRRVLVVGGGDSAVESAVGLANQEGTEVRLSYRGETFSRITDRNREKIGRAIAEGKVQALFASTVREIRPDVVVMESGGQATIVPNDCVIVRIGGEAPYAFLEQLGVQIIQKDVPLPRESARAG